MVEKNIAAGVKADVAGWCAEQPGAAVRLGKFAHVKAQAGALISLWAALAARRANARRIHRATFDLQSNDVPTAKLHT